MTNNEDRRPTTAKEQSARVSIARRSRRTKRLHRSKSYDNKRRRVHDIGLRIIDELANGLRQGRTAAMDGWMDGWTDR